MMTDLENEESASIEIQADSPGGKEKKIDEFINQFGKRHERPETKSPDRCFICRVPNLIRRYKEEAYTPQVVSIGPFHRENEGLNAMEEHKGRFFRNFMTRTRVDLADFQRVIWDREVLIRDSYGETIAPAGDEFVRMVLLDAIFILELFIRCTSNETSDSPNAVDLRGMAIMLDLLLLENQLPYFVLCELYNVAFESDIGYKDFLLVSSGYFVNCLNMQSREAPRNVNIEHLTGLIRAILLPPPPPLSSPWEQLERSSELPKLLYSATRLHVAGVKFVAVTSELYFDIKFDRGVLKIPSFQIGSWTEVLARNILALEQTRDRGNAYYADYFFFLDLLIRTREDVDLLCDKQIFVNNLDDNNDVKSMLNNINRGFVRGSVAANYVRVCRDLNDFYEQRPRWQKWKAVLVREFFSTPSAAVTTVITVVVITVLTFIQTVCSIMQVTGSN